MPMKIEKMNLKKKKWIGLSLVILAVSGVASAEDFKCPVQVGVHSLIKQKVNVLSQQTMLECQYDGVVKSEKGCVDLGSGWEAHEGLGPEGTFYCERLEEFSSPRSVEGKAVNSMKQWMDGVSK